ncbi:hypothetical protein NDU88_004401 [Pleurodeles waltl]|uniref:Uncharacterized protein n=1 Tax=Pleurodeles waltl TaxID=8319 RepID=A0AAV7RGU0_PLEWA|nr:hypothetical protein NDU88_004401 [Pleurodeles waltl]
MATRTQMQLVLSLPLTARKSTREPTFRLAPRSVRGTDGPYKRRLQHTGNGRSEGEDGRTRPARKEGATTGGQLSEIPGTPGRKADRNRTSPSPDPGMKTAGPGEHTSEPATLQEKRGQTRLYFLFYETTDQAVVHFKLASIGTQVTDTVPDSVSCGKGVKF